MSFTSLDFIFIFLPLALLLYYILGEKLKEYVLLMISLVFYALGSFEYLKLFIVATLVNVLIGRLIAKFDNTGRSKYLFWGGIVFNVGLLGFCKFSPNFFMPLGISYFSFKAISYLADVYLGKITLSRSVARDALYLSFFTQIQAGPLSRYDNMNRGIGFDKALFTDGLLRFVIGFNKKILLANVINNITSEIYNAPYTDMSKSYAWLGVFSYTLMLFMDFSGYSDMAIGLSQMFGYRCVENFIYPFMSESMTKIWTRWHASLGAWFKDYVYIPLGGSRNSNKYRVYFNLLIVWILTGIWHGSTVNFVVWGLANFCIIAFERFFNIPKRIENKPLKLLYRIFTVFYMTVTLSLLGATSGRQGLGLIKSMFICQSNKFSDMRVLFLLKDYWFFIATALFISFPIIPYIRQKSRQNKITSIAFNLVFMGIVVFGFIWAMSFVISGQNNPFTYANF